MISTVIGQLSLTDTKDTGFSYLFRGNEFATGGGGGFPIIPIVDDIKDGLTSEAIKGLGLTDFGLRAYGTVGDLSIFVKALQSKTNFTVLSRPSIFTSNNQKGTISSGQRIAVPTNSFNSGATGQSTNIEYQDVVLKLEVIPLVNSDNEITMQIALINDDVIDTQSIEGIGDVPIIATREILTTATVPNNQTIVLGGLIIGRDEQKSSGIPILSDIPYLGRLFGSNGNVDNRNELMVFIQPSVVKNDRSLNAVQTDMDARYKVSGKAREFADGPGVLPPVDAIPVSDKVGTGDVQPPQSTTSTVKPSIRPAFRR
jgi:type II secretory pathway component GspD/PulD (secretin)